MGHRAAWEIGVVLALLAAGAAWAGQPARQAEGLDCFGDPVPKGAIRLGTMRLREGHVISRIAFSPDGKLLASAAAAQEPSEVSLWEPASGRLVRRIAPGSWDFAFLPDGNTLLTVEDRGFRLWEVSTGRPVRWFAPPCEGIRRLAVSPDGRRVLATVHDTAIAKIIDLPTGKWVAGAEGGAMGEFSPDSRLIAAVGPPAVGLGGAMKGADSAGSEVYVDFYDGNSSQAMRSLKGEALWRSAPAFSPDGKLLAWCGIHPRNGRMRLEIIDVAKGAVVRSIEEPLGGDAHIAGGGAMGVAARPAFSPDGKRVAFPGTDLAMHLWDLAKGAEAARLPTPAKLAAFSPDGKVVVTARQHVVELWDVATGRPLLPHLRDQSEIASASFSPDGRTVATACGDGAIRLWDASTGRLAGKLGGHKTNLSSAAFSPDGRTLVSAGYDGVRGWDLATGRQRHHLGLGDGWSNLAGFLEDGQRVCVAGHPAHLIWNATTGQVERTWPAGPHGTTAAAIAPAEQLLAIADGDGRTVSLWSISAGAVRWTIQCDDRDSFQQVCFTSLGDLAVCTTHLKTMFVETCSGRLVRELDRLPGMAGRERATAICPRGRILATVGSGHRIVVLSALTGQELGMLEGHRAWIRSLAFSPDGSRLLSTCNDTTALVWDVSRFAGMAPALAPRQDPARLWELLCGQDANAAYEAVESLIAGGDGAASALADRVKPVDPPDERRLAKLIEDLGAAEFSIRAAASEELRSLDAAAEPALRKALESAGNQEVQVRLQELLAGCDVRLVTSGQEAGRLRAVVALEQIGTAGAKRILQKLSRGAPAALTHRAKAALALIARRETPLAPPASSPAATGPVPTGR